MESKPKDSGAGETGLDKLRRPSPTRRCGMMVLVAVAMALSSVSEVAERGSLLKGVLDGLWILGCVLAGVAMAYVCTLFIKKDCESDPQRMASEARSWIIKLAKGSAGTLPLSIILSLALGQWLENGNGPIDGIRICPINLTLWVPMPLLWLWARRTVPDQHSKPNSTPKTSASDN